jgi:hypothetical protein
MFVRSSLVEPPCPCRDVGEAIPVASLRPIRTACQTLGGHILEHPSCGGFMPTAETTLIPASGINQRAAKKIIDERCAIRQRSQFWRELSMTSYRQIEANRRNALKSTGPKTEAGKQESRRNAVRHGLTAETVISALEDAEDYKAFEAAITADYDAQSAVERELVLRLASILWRLRRATIMETGLFEIQAQHLHDYRQSRQLLPNSREVIHAVFRRTDSVSAGPASNPVGNIETPLDSGMKDDATALEFARCFLRLANLPNFALDRLSRYETALWRQAGQILYALETLDRRKPQERSRRFWFAREGQIQRE